MPGGQVLELELGVSVKVCWSESHILVFSKYGIGWVTAVCESVLALSVVDWISGLSVADGYSLFSSCD